MSILCLDIATVTGWALWSGYNDLRSGVLNISGPTDGRRLLNLWRYLNDTHRGNSIDHVFYEKAVSFAGKGKANVVMHQLLGVLELWGELNEVPLDFVNPSTLKKFATGNGRADKPMMVAAAEKLYQCKVSDHNEADALLVLSWAMSEYGYQHIA